MSKIVNLSWAVGALLALGGCAASPEADASPNGNGVGVQTGGATAGAGGTVATGGTDTQAGSGGMTGGVPAAQTGVPCEVAQVVATHCSMCHGNPTNWGGPMSLVTRDDFFAMGKLTTASVVHDLVNDRINRAAGTAGAMPPAGPMPAADLDVLNQWLASGAPAGQECQPVGGGALDGTGGVVATTGGDTGSGGWISTGEDKDWPDGVMPEETCYSFLKHGQPNPTDMTPHTAPTGEVYSNFYYTVPWKEPVVATRWRTIYDNTQILHHWLLYKYPAGKKADGFIENTIGSHIGEGVQLVAGWAVGGGDETFPPGVGLRMAAPGGMLMLEWHLYNTTGAPVPDRSGIEICVVPEAKVFPAKVAGLTWLGTENFNGPLGMPAGAESKFEGTCHPSFKNGGPIHIVKFLPHMHFIGKHMTSWVTRGGKEELVFDEPFQFDRQISYDMNPPLILNEGDTIRSQCTFFNNTSRSVAYGPSTDQEMCYQFAMAYPAGSLENSSATLTGADNTCLN